jgi:hypothetical protein
LSGNILTIKEIPELLLGSLETIFTTAQFSQIHTEKAESQSTGAILTIGIAMMTADF